MAPILHNLPQWIEVRVPGLVRRHLVDYDSVIPRDCFTVDAYIVAASHALMELRAKLIEDALLEGHNRIEVQIDGDSTTVHLVSDWFTETRAWLKVWWARWRHRRERQR